MEAFSIRELRERSGDLVRELEGGHLAVITKHGRPLAVTVPMTEALLSAGVGVAIAVELFKSKSLSLGLAAKVSGLDYAAFIDHLAELGIPVVDYDPADLSREIDLLEQRRRR
jgi:prevent-host-death family protein